MTDDSNWSVLALKRHLEALRAADLEGLKLAREADQRAIDQAAEWTKERLQSHNDLLNKWRDSSEKDRLNFVTVEAFEALKQAFDLYKEITAKALTLAEGKSKGMDAVRAAVSFIVGMLLAGLGMWAAFKGIH